MIKQVISPAEMTLGPGLVLTPEEIIQFAPAIILLSHFENPYLGYAGSQGGVVGAYPVDYPPGFYGVDGHLSFGAMGGSNMFGNYCLENNINWRTDKNRIVPPFSTLSPLDSFSIAHGIWFDEMHSPYNTYVIVVQQEHKFKIEYRADAGNHINSIRATAWDQNQQPVSITVVVDWPLWVIWHWMNFVVSPANLHLYLDDALAGSADFSGSYDPSLPGDGKREQFLRFFYPDNQSIVAIDELIIRANADQILKPASAFKIYPETHPVAVLDLSDLAGATLKPSTIQFADETAFASESLKLRLGNQGSFLTLSAFRGLAKVVVKVGDTLEFQFGGNGNTQVELSPGSIEIKPK